MKSLAKIFTSTAFRLAVMFTLVFASSMALLIGYIYWNSNLLLQRNVTEIVQSEAESLSHEYEAGGIVRLVNIIEQRSSAPGDMIYLLLDFRGQSLAGNLYNVPTELDGPPRWIEFYYDRFDAGVRYDSLARARIFRLPGGYILLVGRAITELRRFEKVIKSALYWSIGLTLVIGLLAGIIVSRRMLIRVDRMTESSNRIMAGDLTERIPESGSGDELDRLAHSLNAMLERINELLHGMREVSDNIAHDLKTPLTRLRNRVETTLRSKASTKAYRGALEQTIEESDHLIRIFNALLAIARVEAGAGEADFTEIETRSMLGDIAELYEPAADEIDATIVVEEGGPETFRGDRELISQALANLIDNALKYGRDEDAADVKLVIRLRAEQIDRDVRLSVIDNGPGIPPGERARVLERFVRLESSRSAPGSGLGLSLVAAVAGYHNGKVEISDVGANDDGQDLSTGFSVALMLINAAE